MRLLRLPPCVRRQWCGDPSLLLRPEQRAAPGRESPLTGVSVCLPRQEVLRKPVAVWSHLDIDFAAEVAEGAPGLELSAGALLPALPSGRRRVRRPRLLPALSAAPRALTCGRADAAAEPAGASWSGGKRAFRQAKSLYRFSMLCVVGA